MCGFDKLVNRNLSLLDVVAPVAAEGQNGIPCDSGEDRAVEHRCDNLARNLEDDIHRADFLNILSLDSVKPQNLRIAVVVRLYLSRQRRSVVSARLGVAYSASYRSYIVVLYPNSYGSEPALIVGSGGRKYDHEEVAL